VCHTKIQYPKWPKCMEAQVPASILVSCVPQNILIFLERIFDLLSSEPSPCRRVASYSFVFVTIPFGYMHCKVSLAMFALLLFGRGEALAHIFRSVA
jgi:hypothetical protein